MKKKDLAEKLKLIRSLKKEDGFDNDKEIEEIIIPLIKELFEEKKYKDIVEIFLKTLSAEDPGYYEFETAYSFDNLGKQDEAEEIYDSLLFFDGGNTSVLNNLSNIKKNKGEMNEAWDLIKKAFELTKGKDEVVKRNYNSLLKIVEEQKQIDYLFESAKNSLEKETKWAISKLEYFLINVLKDSEYKDGQIPIARWKFKVMMGVDEEKASSLRDQWINKGYIKVLEKRNEHGVQFYKINPKLSSFIKQVKPVDLNNEWFKGIDNVNRESLEKCGYFNLLKKIEHVSVKYKSLVKRDYDELVFNYLLGNKKSTIINSGSFLELLFTYFCEKKKILSISYTINNKIVNKKLHESNLNDFLSYFEEKQTFKTIIVSLGEVTRIYRNFIHPGNEIRNKEKLDMQKAELCFFSVNQIANYLLK
ncbi:MAG: hypothetical protein KGI58_02745 [Patescibacteria group bacterium]|nr:hypothetical protein [Patescibacteria group bacterium]